MTENGSLDLLLETETRLAARLADAQRKAEARLAAARQAQLDAEAHFHGNLGRAMRELATALAAQSESEVNQLKAEAEVAARRFEGLSQQRIDALAHGVARRVLDGWRAEGAT